MTVGAAPEARRALLQPDGLEHVQQQAGVADRVLQLSEFMGDVVQRHRHDRRVVSRAIRSPSRQALVAFDLPGSNRSAARLSTRAATASWDGASGDLSAIKNIRSSPESRLCPGPEPGSVGGMLLGEDLLLLV